MERIVPYLHFYPFYFFFPVSISWIQWKHVRLYPSDVSILNAELLPVFPWEWQTTQHTYRYHKPSIIIFPIAFRLSSRSSIITVLISYFLSSLLTLFPFNLYLGNGICFSFLFKTHAFLIASMHALSLLSYIVTCNRYLVNLLVF